MACKTNIKNRLEEELSEKMAEYSYGTRQAAIKNANKINSKYPHKVIYPMKMSNGVYKLSISNYRLRELIENEYSKQKDLEAAINKKLETAQFDPINKPDLGSTSDIEGTVEPVKSNYKKPPKKPDLTIKNRRELGKGTTSAETMMSALSVREKFNKVFPQYAHLGKKEYEWMLDILWNGHLPMSCKI